MVTSGPPFDRYPPMVDGTREISYNGKKIQNIFDIKRQLFERESKNFRSQEFYRATSKQLLSEFSDAQIVGEDNEVHDVAVWYANYERAIAKIFESRNLTLPCMTIGIADTEQDLARRRPNFDVEFWTVQNKKTRRHTRVASLAPQAVNVSYQLHLWSRYVEDMNQLLEYVLSKFHPFLRVETNFMTNACAFITAISDNSEVEAPDEKDRVLKKTITFNVETYLPSRKYQIQSNGDITSMNYEVQIKPGIDFSGIPPVSATETLVMYPTSSIA
mgnify:FL=1